MSFSFLFSSSTYYSSEHGYYYYHSVDNWRLIFNSLILKYLQGFNKIIMKLHYDGFWHCVNDSNFREV